MENKQDLLDMYKILNPHIKRPYRRVFTENAKIWKNNSFDKWHLPFPPIFSNFLLSCPDDRCSHQSHFFGEYTFCDPWSLGAIFKLKKGMKILVLLNYCNTDHVSFFTFSNFSDYPYYIRFYSIEKSKNCWFFSPPKKKEYWGNDFGVTVQWACVKYLAIIDSDQPSFGKYGGLACFKRELARLTDNSLKEINATIKRLDALKPMPSRPKLKHFSWGGNYFFNLIVKEKNPLSLMDKYFKGEKAIEELSYLFLCLTERRELDNFVKLINEWKPAQPKALRQGLEKATCWYLNSCSGKTNFINQWWQTWDKLWEIGPIPNW